MIFVAASALLSIATHETGALDLSDILEANRNRLCSSISLWQTTAGLCRRHIFSVESARERVTLLRELFRLQMVSIGEREHDLAIQAYAQFGLGRHPAGLNMSDCYAYACAKVNRASLLFTGDDFSKTDIRVASVKG